VRERSESWRRRAGLILLWSLVVSSCDRTPPGPTPEETAERVRQEVAAVLDRSFAEVRAQADEMDDILQPVPLMLPSERTALRRYLQAQHLARARALGVRPANGEELERMLADGRLVVLTDSTEHWITRGLGGSMPLVTPSARALLELLGERFHGRLAEMGLPPFRFEITSVFRTAETQARLRERNANAAAGTSTHEFGTTVDVSYAAFTAPEDIPLGMASSSEPWLAPYLELFARGLAERVAGRRSGELKAIFGAVLREMQSEGLVLVILEEQQPVFHLTVAEDVSIRP